MTRYRLKDRALQKQLDSISNGAFSEKLNTEAQKMFSPVLAREVFRVYFGDFDALANRFSVLFELDEIEETPEYDPTRWNVYPDVEPPSDVLLRIECYYEDDEPDENGQPNIRYRGCLKYSKDYGFGLMLNQSEKPQRIRFRPWIGPEEEGEE